MKARLVELGSLAEIIMGQAPPGRDCNKAGNGTVFVKAGEFDERFPIVREWTTKPLRYAQRGDVLVCVVGATAGKVNEGIDCAIGRSVAAVRPKNGSLAGPYLYHFLTTKTLALRRQSQGLAQGVITREMLGQLNVPLLPVTEQRRIAAILDQADALRAKRRQALEQLGQLAESIFVSMFGDPVTNPKRWLQRPVTEVCALYSGGTPSKKNPELWRGNLPWFSPKDLKESDLFDSIDHISEDVPERTNLRLLAKNTVVLVVRGMILAHTFPVAVLRVPSTINQDLKALCPRQPMEPQFLAHCLRVQRRHALAQVSTAAHGTKRLDTDGLRKIPLLLPSLDLQTRFASQVAAVERLKAAHRESLAKLDALFASLQHRAFRGEL